MIPVTALLAVFSVLTALLVRPGRGVGIVIMSMLLYPDYLRLPLGLAQMSVPRLVALAILVRGYPRWRQHGTSLRSIDWIVICLWIWGLLAGLAGGASDATLTWLIGNGLDTVLMYYCARFTLLYPADYGDACEPLALTAAVLGVLGLCEAVFHFAPYKPLMNYHQWLWVDKGDEYRLGLLRARGSQSHPIPFGMVMFMLGSYLWSLSEFSRLPRIMKLAAFAAFVGTASSLSSGPQISLLVFAATGIFYLAPGAIKYGLALLALSCLIVEAISNRHFYNMVDYLNVFGGGSWYRTRLMEVAVNQLPEYWLVGYGGDPPSHWGKLIDGRKHVDIVNHYVFLAVQSGILSALGLLCCQLLPIASASRYWRRLPLQARWMEFFAGCAMSGVIIGSMSVSLFGAPVMLMYIMLGSTFLPRTRD